MVQTMEEKWTCSSILADAIVNYALETIFEYFRSGAIPELMTFANLGYWYWVQISRACGF